MRALVSSVLLGVKLRRVGHELSRVLHVRVSEKGEVRGLFVSPFRVGTCGEIVIVSCRTMMRCGLLVMIGTTSFFQSMLRIVHVLKYSR